VKFAVREDRLKIVTERGTVDVEDATAGAVGSDPCRGYERWSETVARCAAVDLDAAPATPFDVSDLSAPSPAPRQVFALGTNYRSHAVELGWAIPDVPMVFTKFSSSVTGPSAPIPVARPRVDWEVELVVVIGAGGHDISAEHAFDAVAGYTVGQDISDRDTQNTPKTNPQFSLGKSYPGFAPTGPCLVSVDEFADRDNIRLGCSLDGETLQEGSTDDFVFDVATIVSYLSGIVTLLPGDLIFTGTPSGIGSRRTPPRFLSPGSELVSWVEGIGEIRNPITAG
jgi:2-keto-4-pentenoate hydratase/2-oxohepta-3-ene-1,7-dioic acid hydratase in catechol pathway